MNSVSQGTSSKTPTGKTCHPTLNVNLDSYYINTMGASHQAEPIPGTMTLDVEAISPSDNPFRTNTNSAEATRVFSILLLDWYCLSTEFECHWDLYTFVQIRSAFKNVRDKRFFFFLHKIEHAFVQRSPLFQNLVEKLWLKNKVSTHLIAKLSDIDVVCLARATQSPIHQHS